MRHRVVIAVEAHVGRLAHSGLTTLVCGEGIVRKPEEVRLFLCEGIADQPLIVLWPAALACLAHAPRVGLPRAAFLVRAAVEHARPQ